MQLKQTIIKDLHYNIKYAVLEEVCNEFGCVNKVTVWMTNVMRMPACVSFSSGCVVYASFSPPPCPSSSACICGAPTKKTQIFQTCLSFASSSLLSTLRRDRFALYRDDVGDGACALALLVVAPPLSGREEWEGGEEGKEGVMAQKVCPHLPLTLLHLEMGSDLVSQNSQPEKTFFDSH